MPNVLLVGDSVRSSELRHEVSVAIGDAFRYVELDGRRIAVVWSVEGDRITAVDPTVEIVPVETFSYDDLLRDGVDYYEISPTLTVRIARSLGLRDAVVPASFPLRHADALRADGVELTVDQRHFDDRRRRKTPRQLEGIRIASRAAEAGMAAIAALLARSEPSDEGRVADGEPLTSRAPPGGCDRRVRGARMQRRRPDRRPRPAGGRRPRSRLRPARATTTTSSATSSRGTSTAAASRT